MSQVAELARALDSVRTASSGTDAALVFGHVTKDIMHDGEVAVQADDLPLTEDDLGFAEGLRRGVERGDRVLLLRSADEQHYDVLLIMEGG
nr:hypothetical protein [uncultured Agathobaculum sp.]